MTHPFKSFSQAAQDRFVMAVLDGKREGTFIDVGCCHPTELSNTYALESQFGWRGVCVDIDENAIALHRRQRANVAWCADSTKIEWDARLENIEPKFGYIFDYLSLDVDSATLATLKNLLCYELRFRVITVEHDAYRFGGEARTAIRQLLQKEGYDLICADVRAATGEEFEDWWIDSMADGVDLNAAEKLHCTSKKWTEIFPA